MGKDLHTTINGILIPDAWDDRGNVVGVAVFTFQEEKVRIVDDRLGKALKQYLRKRVIIDGDMITHDPTASIRVRQYWIDSG